MTNEPAPSDSPPNVTTPDLDDDTSPTQRKLTAIQDDLSVDDEAPAAPVGASTGAKDRAC